MLIIYKTFAMTTEEQALSPQESLRLITDAISRTKEDLAKNSFPFLLWGWLIASASFAFFVLHQYTTSPYYFLPFPVLAIAGMIRTVVYYRQRSTSATLSYYTVFLYKLWFVLGISFIAVVFLNVSQSKLPFTYTLLIGGIGTLASGLIMKFDALTIGGVLFFIAAIGSVYVTDDYKPLLHGVAIIFGYLIPGYRLKKFKA